MRSKAALVLLFALNVCRLLAQQTGTGLYQFGSFDARGFDTINLGNLNVHFEIPIVSRPGRGLPFNFTLVYDGLIWNRVSSGGGDTWVPDAQMGFNSALNGSTITGYLTHDTSSQACYDGYSTFTRSNYAYHDPSGIIHPFNYSWYSPCPVDANGNPVSNSDQYYGDGSTVDGSGYRLNTNANSVTTRSGATINPVTSSNYTGDGSIVDANGNTITNSANQVLYDTMGVAALTIAGNGTAASPRTYKYPVNYQQDGSSTVTGSVNYKTYTVQTNFGCGVGEFGAQSMDLVDNVTLADGSKYSFTYEATPGHSGAVTGRLGSITLPSGGVITYTYTGGANGVICADGTVAAFTRTTSDGVRLYSRNSGANGNGAVNAYTGIVQDEAGNRSLYHFSVDSSGKPEATHQQAYQGSDSNGTLLMDVSTCYNGAASPCDGGAIQAPIFSLSTTKTYNGGASDVTTSTYDATGNISSLVTPDTLTTTYTYNSANGLIAQTTKDPSGNFLRSVTNQYDETSPIATSGIPQHAASVPGPRNNLTSTQLFTGTGNLKTTYAVYDTGSVSTSTFNNAVTTFGYDATQTFVTQTTLPTPSSGVSMSTGAGYDVASAALYVSADVNNNQTNINSYDRLMRPTKITPPPGGGVITAQYTPTQSGVQQQIDNTRSSDTEILYDGYGRVSRKAVKNDSAWYLTDTCYDAVGNQQYQTLPYYSTSYQIAAQCTSKPHVTYAYDALGRNTSTVYPDGTSRTTKYQNRSTRTVDENGVTKVISMDLTGRTTGVCEVSNGADLVNSGSPVSCGTDFTDSGYLTTYTYDDTNHKTTVAQGSQVHRVFQTDPLGRLTFQSEPESGVTTYSYNYNSTGLDVTRTRPRANQNDPNTVTTTDTQYDVFGRLLGKNYRDNGQLTSWTSYSYDVAPQWTYGAVQYPKGQLTVASSPDNGTWFNYDSMGRVQNTTQCFPGTCANWSLATARLYEYDLAGNRTASLYQKPGTSTWEGLNTTYTLAGEVSGMVTGGPDFNQAGAPVNYGGLVSNINQGPYGPNSWQLANGLTESVGYDSVGRLDARYDCFTGNTNNCLYSFQQTISGNRVTDALDSILGQGHSTFSYDSLNRLSGASYPGLAKAYTMSYDRYGNRWSQQYTQGTGVNASFGYDQGNNRNTSFGYDAAGNQTNDALHTYTYDAEGNVTKVDGGGTASYTFDALNHRTRALANGVNTLSAYDLDGNRVMAFDGGTLALKATNVFWGGRMLATYANGQVNFHHGDALGTARFTTGPTASLVGTYKSLAFGDGEQAAGTDTDPQHFAGLDGDASSGTDNAQFRQYSPSQGRWLSPDPYSGSYDTGNPQSLNRYAYVLNNPMAYRDASGLTPICVSTTITTYTNNPGELFYNPNGDYWFYGNESNTVDVSSGPTTCTDPTGGGNSPSTGNSSNTGSNTGGGSGGGTTAPSKTACFLRGAAVGAGGALLVAGAAAGAVALGAPAAVVTGGLLLAGGVGGGLTAASTYNDIRNGNYAGAAYSVGSVVGGVAVGGAVGGAVGDGINPPASRGWSFGGDWANRFNPGLGSVGKWLGTGPDAAAAGGSIAGAASKLASFLRGPC